MTSDNRPAESSICEIFRGHQAVGLGFAIAPARVVTCAHVVNAALGRPDIRDPLQPGERERVLVRFGIAEDVRRDRYLDASVGGWLPAEDGAFDMDDVAILDLAQSAPGHVRPLRLVPHQPSMRVQMWGPQPARPDGGHVRGELLGRVRGGRVQISVNGHGPFKVRPGFSGGPVWEPGTGDAVGVLAACGTEENATDAYLLRTDQIEAAKSSWQAPPATQVDQPRHRAPRRTAPVSKARITILAAGLAVVVAALSAAVLLPGSDHPAATGADASPAATARTVPKPAATRPKSRPRPAHTHAAVAGPASPAAVPATTAPAPPPLSDPVPSVRVTSDPNAGPDDPNEISGSEVDAYLDHCIAWLDKDGSGDLTGVLDPIVENCSAELIRSGGPSVTFPVSSNGESTSPVPAVGHSVKICAWLDGDKSTTECSPPFSR
ncbi:MAG: serine protease [Streptosporangiales bacterium]|nr:serine protease [Streptosporangiales bacterium]